MVFSSLLYLFLYLPAALAVYYILPQTWPKNRRNAALFISSLLFYAWGEPVYVLLMLFTISFGWFTGILLERWQAARQRAKAVLIVNIVVNLGILCFFKYGDFFIHNINSLAGLHLVRPSLPLPLGISFYMFQTISYAVDIYRGATPPQPNIINYGAYVAMFPQLIAGPIIRYNTVAGQIENRRETLRLFGGGAGLFTVGLAKKVLLANNIGAFWDTVKALPAEEMTVLAAWSGIIAFGLQLYFDFSGYSDMAIGLGRMLGFRFERNFFYPYVSRSVSEFWRRWHISLGTWFREYLYIPLGGSRGGRLRTVLNLFAVWAATGFWHGANWNFIFWGLYYFLFLAGEKMIWGSLLDQTPKGLRHLYVLAVVMAGWALFVFEDLGSLGIFIRALGGIAGGGWANDRILYSLSSWGFLLLAAAIGATPLAASALRWSEGKWPSGMAVVKPALLLAGLVLSTAYLVDSSYNPFLYFRF